MQREYCFYPKTKGTYLFLLFPTIPWAKENNLKITYVFITGKKCKQNEMRKRWQEKETVIEGRGKTRGKGSRREDDHRGGKRGQKDREKLRVTVRRQGGSAGPWVWRWVWSSSRKGLDLFLVLSSQRVVDAMPEGRWRCGSQPAPAGEGLSPRPASGKPACVEMSF